MFPGLNPKQMEQAMKQLGMKIEEIDADEVIIKTSSANIVIKNPRVAKVNIMGKDTFQISGEIQEEAKEISDDDIALVAKQAHVSKEEAKKVLKKTKGDIAEAILMLQKIEDV